MAGPTADLMRPPNMLKVWGPQAPREKKSEGALLRVLGAN